MITRVHIKNYRSLEDVSVDLGPLTVLVGRNGAGKSNFVDAILFMQDSLQSGLEESVSRRDGLSGLRRWTAHGRPCDVEIEISIKQKGLKGRYGFVLAAGTGGEFKVKRETCSVANVSAQSEHDDYEIRDGAWIKSPDSLNIHDSLEAASGSLSAKRLSTQALFLPSARILGLSLFTDLWRTLTGNNFYAIYPNTLRLPQRLSNARVMSDDGENFSTALREIKRRWDENGSGSYQELLAAVRRVVDDVTDINVKLVGGYLVTELKHKFQRSTKVDEPEENSPWFELSQESDGTLRALGLLIGIYQSEPQNGLMAIEEPEMNIHPGALGVLADLLQEASHRRQLLLTTHSPDLISRFSVDQLRIVERIAGSTRIGRLAESQRETIEKQLFTTGDLLRIEGLQSSVEEAEALHA